MTDESIKDLLGILIFLFVGIYIFIYVVYTTVKSLIALGWKKTTGEIRKVHVKDTVDEDGASYDTRIEYSYNVDGLTLISNRTAFGLLSSSNSWINSRVFMEVTKNYPFISVYYDPKNFGEAVIIAGLRKFHMVNIIFCLFFNSFVFFAASSIYAKHSTSYTNLLHNIISYITLGP